MPPLVPSIRDEAPNLVNTILQLLLDSDNYGERKGAAYGLAGLVKGLGILSLKQLNIMNTLTTAIQNKKNYKHREGNLKKFYFQEEEKKPCIYFTFYSSQEIYKSVSPPLLIFMVSNNIFSYFNL